MDDILHSSERPKVKRQEKGLLKRASDASLMYALLLYKNYASVMAQLSLCTQGKDAVYPTLHVAPNAGSYTVVHNFGHTERLNSILELVTGTRRQSLSAASMTKEVLVLVLMIGPRREDSDDVIHRALTSWSLSHVRRPRLSNIGNESSGDDCGYDTCSDTSCSTELAMSSVSKEDEDSLSTDGSFSVSFESADELNNLCSPPFLSSFSGTVNIGVHLFAHFDWSQKCPPPMH